MLHLMSCQVVTIEELVLLLWLLLSLGVGVCKGGLYGTRSLQDRCLPPHCLPP